VRAALDLAGRPELEGRRVVTVIPDSGERYMSMPFFAP
jgi:cysteine synthase